MRLIVLYYAPFEEEGYIALHMSVGRSVGPYVDQSLSEYNSIMPVPMVLKLDWGVGPDQ